MGSDFSTSATGGSAASQAASLDDRAWNASPWAARLIRLVMLLGPMLGGFVAVAAAVRIVEKPSGLGPAGAWLILLIAVSAAGAHVVQTMTMRLAPLSALFRLSLVFPDEAPSRFSIALRQGSARRLEERAGVGAEQQAAEHLLHLVAQLSAHDRSTRGHSERVRAYSVMLGEEIGLPPEELDKLNWAALIHDVGKLHVPQAILNKPGRPTAEEWDVLRSHPGAAEQHVEALRPWLGEWVDAATQHHERIDGQGYPAGLRGDEISLAGRLVAIADAFDVMTAPRSYKPSLPFDQARAELLSCAGSQFDSALVRSFLRISLGRTRWVAGPLGWLSYFPEIVRTPVVAAASGGQAVIAATVVSVAVATGVIAPTEDFPVPPVERVVDEAVETVPAPSLTTLGPTSTTVPGEPTTTATAPTTSIPMKTAAPTTTAPTTTIPMKTAAPTTTIPMKTAAPTTTAPTTTAPTTTAPTTTAPTTVAAQPDNLAISRAGNTTLHVIANDDFGGSSPDAATLQIIGSVDHGSIAVAGLNLRYTLDEGIVSGTESFSYSICSVGGDCDTGDVSLTIDIA